MDKQLIIMSKLNYIFYKHYTEYSEVFFTDDKDYYKLRLKGYTKINVEEMVKFIKENECYKITKRDLLIGSTYKNEYLINFINNEKIEISFVIEEQIGDYLDRISQVEFLKELL